MNGNTIAVSVAQVTHTIQVSPVAIPLMMFMFWEIYHLQRNIPTKQSSCELVLAAHSKLGLRPYIDIPKDRTAPSRLSTVSVLFYYIHTAKGRPE